jgi:Ca2+-binding RTX toxin-like protein
VARANNLFLFGTNNQDNIRGLAGNEVLGGSGDDTLAGGSDDDVLIGGGSLLTDA